ncbi:CUB and sushi domain-containing protein 1-like [Ruditapes philippinarum]|uniref:CUB and sushi domain-containing protein 1-like n=1 Tax=Ruditapes philippinarum TaxID=129788 RepID=UPI00295B541B|nr:CUB and sushi domain-containing protein 1-like [Ruditapes philippinarum]
MKMKYNKLRDNVFSLTILFILNLKEIASEYTGTCNPFQSKLEHLNLRLKEHMIHETSTDLHNCARFCLYLTACKSFDYDRQTNACKLNDADSTDVQTTEFEMKELSIYSDINEWPQGIAGPCGSRPCSPNQRCLPSYPPRCINIGCGAVESIDNGIIELAITGKDMFLDEAYVDCNIGYIVENPVAKCLIVDILSKAECFYTDISTVQCHVEGKWEEKTCDPKDCGQPTTENGIATLLDSSNTTYMALATVKCNEGYETNISRVKCQSDGTWSAGNCSKISCGSLPGIANGVATLSLPGSTLYLDTATLECNYGFTATPATFKCLSSKSWEYSHCACMPPNSYAGSLGSTTSGKTCQRWDSQFPHSHKKTSAALYPDTSVSAANNYCRAVGETYLWCYTTDIFKRWDYCNKPTYVC